MLAFRKLDAVAEGGQMTPATVPVRPKDSFNSGCCAASVLAHMPPLGIAHSRCPTAYALPAGSVFLLIGGVGVAELADGAGIQVGQGEGVGSVHSQVLAHERAEPGGVFLEHPVALGL